MVRADAKQNRGHRLRFEATVKIYSDLKKKLAQVTEHYFQAFCLKNIKHESTEANYLCHIFCKWVCSVNNSKF